MSSLVEKEDPLQPNVLSRFLAKVRNEQPKMHDDTQGFLSAGNQCNSFTVYRLTPFRFCVPTESS